jgi:hypothetical protein
VLKAPGRNRLPLYEKLTGELARAATAAPKERRRVLGQAGWTQLVSAEIEHVARDRDLFLRYFECAHAADRRAGAGRAVLCRVQRLPGDLSDQRSKRKASMPTSAASAWRISSALAAR